MMGRRAESGELQAKYEKQHRKFIDEGDKLWGSAQMNRNGFI